MNEGGEESDGERRTDGEVDANDTGRMPVLRQHFQIEITDGALGFWALLVQWKARA